MPCSHCFEKYNTISILLLLLYVVGIYRVRGSEYREFSSKKINQKPNGSYYRVYNIILTDVASDLR